MAWKKTEDLACSFWVELHHYPHLQIKVTSSRIGNIFSKSQNKGWHHNLLTSKFQTFWNDCIGNLLWYKRVPKLCLDRTHLWYPRWWATQLDSSPDWEGCGFIYFLKRLEWMANDCWIWLTWGVYWVDKKKIWGEWKSYDTL